jgi:hypothetical protein
MMPIRGNMALYIGGMGARDKNFYNDYAKRLGFESAAAKIQDLYLAGKREEAMAAVPEELIDACHLRSCATLDRSRQEGPRRIDADRQRPAAGPRADGRADALTAPEPVRRFR